MLIESHKNLKQYNTFMVSAEAKYFAMVTDNDSLYKILGSKEWSFSEKHFVLGGGSNVLFISDFDGFVLKNEIKGIDIVKEEADSVTVRVGAGEPWHNFVMWSVERGYWGIENLAYIPGSVGASPVQNIGAYGVSVADSIHLVEYVELPHAEKKILFHDECDFGYRTSIFKENPQKYIITHVYFILKKSGKPITSYGRVEELLIQKSIANPTSKDIAETIIDIRKSKLPELGEIGMAGSFFKNPIVSKKHFETLKRDFPDIKSFDSGSEVKIPAGWILETLGYKGFKKGNTGNYDKHALVIIHNGEGTGVEVYEYVQSIINHVKKVFNITLEPEVNII